MKKENTSFVFDRIFLGRPYGKLGLYAFFLTVIVGGLSSVPGWELLGFTIPPAVFFVIATTVGIAAGAIGAKLRIAGAVAAGLCGAGSAGALWILLTFVSIVPNVVIMLVLLVGCLPGMGVYWLAEWWARRSGKGIANRVKRSRIPDHFP
jgi:hypothetical protein